MVSVKLTSLTLLCLNHRNCRSQAEYCYWKMSPANFSSLVLNDRHDYDPLTSPAMGGGGWNYSIMKVMFVMFLQCAEVDFFF